MGSFKRSRRKEEKSKSYSDNDSNFHDTHIMDNDDWPDNDDDQFGGGDDESDDEELDEEGDNSSGNEYDDENQEDMEEEEEERDDAEKDAEMAELEQEYMELQHVEQDALKNLKRHKDEDLLIGLAVKNQKALWEKALEFRFLLQKAYSSSNRLSQEPIRTLFCSSSDEVTEAYSDLITSTEKTLDSIHQLQEALLEKNPNIQSSGATFEKDSKQSVSSGNSDGEGDEQWLRILEMHSRMAPFRNKSIDKWQRKAEVTTGAASMKGKLHAFNQSISQQVAGYMRDPSKMIKGMLQNKSAVAQFGTVLDSAGSTNSEVMSMDGGGDPELVDDSDFYQQLLKEFFETIDPNSSETAFYAVKRLQTKKRKIVDRRASKSRKIRYNVHEKVVNFMAPQPMDLPPMAPKLFENLFGLKTQKQYAEA